MSTKSQLQIGESIMVIFIVVIVLVLGFVVYINFVTSDFDRKDLENKKDSSEVISFKAANIVELYCTSEGVPDYGCYDIEKVSALKQILEDPNEEDARLIFNSNFGEAAVIVSLIYPPPGVVYILYDNQPADFDNAIPSYIPIRIYDPIQKTYGFGIVEVIKYY